MNSLIKEVKSDLFCQWNIKKYSVSFYSLRFSYNMRMLIWSCDSKKTGKIPSLSAIPGNAQRGNFTFSSLLSNQLTLWFTNQHTAFDCRLVCSWFHHIIHPILICNSVSLRQLVLNKATCAVYNICRNIVPRHFYGEYIHYVVQIIWWYDRSIWNRSVLANHINRICFQGNQELKLAKIGLWEIFGSQMSCHECVNLPRVPVAVTICNNNQLEKKNLYFLWFSFTVKWSIL